MAPTETEVWYVVQVFRKWASLEVLGWPLGAEPTAPGCVGFMPIFKNIEAAKAWRDDEHPNAGIVGIMPGAAR